MKIYFGSKDKSLKLFLNNKNKILRIQDVSLGGTNYAVIEPKEILAEPIKMSANRIILLHNHPSGDATPSKEDMIITEKLKNIGNMHAIYLIDHIIIGKDNYYSFFEDNNILTHNK